MSECMALMQLRILLIHVMPLMNYGVDRYKYKNCHWQKKKSCQRRREHYLQLQVNDWWRTIPRRNTDTDINAPARFFYKPQENTPFISLKNQRPNLWQREIIELCEKSPSILSTTPNPGHEWRVGNPGTMTILKTDSTKNSWWTMVGDVTILQSHTNVAITTTGT